MAGLTEIDRARVRHHLGYLQTEPVSSIQLGVPSASQALFLVEKQMDRLVPAAVPMILRYLSILDSIELQMVDGLKRLKAVRLGELQLRNSNEDQTEQDLLEREYVRWAKRLADDLGAPLNPFSERFRATPINVPVAGG